MKKIVSLFLFFAAFTFGAVVNPSQSSIAILLDASDLCIDKASASWKNMRVKEFLKDYAFYGKSNSIYCYSYDKSMTPPEAANSLFKGSESVFQKALTEWEKGASDLTNKPNKFVIIAEGVAGLAVREYIQSKDYQGEIDNVIFFNTPHEGTGYADQYLLNGSSVLKKEKSVSDYSDIIPLALAVYLVGGGAALEDLMMSLLKEAVLGMAQNAGNIKKNFSSYFENPDKYYKSLLYLAQDLDLNDNAYKSVQEKAEQKKIELKDYAGSTQLLNSYSMLNTYDHPAYNNVYSYGLPTIGNGRRTLADFADQPKNHVNKEKLQEALAASVSATLNKAGKSFDQDEVNRIFSNTMNGDFTAGAMQAANQIASRYGIPVNQISDCVRDISSLSKLRFNKENLSEDILTVIRIANKYLPEKYKSELFSTFIDKYSKTLSDLGESVKSIEGDLKKGMDLVSNNLSNYAINFFDEGTFNVPASSAIGKNVRAFNESSVFRIGYSLKDYVQDNKSSYTSLNDYMDYVSKAGELEGIRQDIDYGLKIGCSAADLVPPAGEVCRTAQFLANVALIADVSMTIEEAVAKVGALEGVRYAAVNQSVKRERGYSSWYDHSGNKRDIESSGMESMLFGTPIVSLQTVRKTVNGVDSIVPLALYQTFDIVEKYSDIVSDSVVYGYSVSESEFAEINRNHLTNSSSMMIKDVRSEQKGGRLYRYARYAALDAFTVSDFIREYRFIIDDFQPDELRLIKLDFNARMQIAYERDGSKWKIYRGTDNSWELIGSLSESPVRKDGLFVFRPKEILNMGVVDKKDSTYLSAIQEDGANSVSIYVVNKAGYANNQRITFRFQAVDYLVEEGWPKSFERVSKMNIVDIYSNDLGYNASLGDRSLIVSGLGKEDTVQVFADKVEGSGNRYRFWADLSSIWAKHPLENATYTLKWSLGFKVATLKEDGTTGTQDITYTPQVIVWGDTSAPQISFDSLFIPKAIALNNDGALAYVVNEDTSDNRVLRGLRSFIVRKNTKDTIKLLHRAHVGEPSYEIRWDRESASWSDSADLYVQAYDFANPDSLMKKELINVSSDSAKNSWSIVMQYSIKFRSGINGTTIHRPILIDNAAPQVANESVKAINSADASLPSFTKQNNGADLLLNAKDTLQVSFDVEENLLDRNSETVAVELVFTDVRDESESKRFLFDFVVSKSLKRFVFEEPSINRLSDGIYSVTALITDVAGNRSEKRLMEKLRVDRTPPQIRGISLGDVAFDNIAELQKGTAHLSQIADDERNRSDLACYVKVNVNDKEGSWKGPVAETVSKGGTSLNYKFDIKSAVSDASDGRWYVYFGCYDGAGNFEKNMNFMGMGSRYPEITLPEIGSGSYNGRILVRGIAPNPDIYGNNNNGEFRVYWKKQEEGASWSEDGIEYLVFDKSLLPSERDLAVWNTTELNLDKGGYDLKLSVRSCDTCEWVSNERAISLDDFVVPDLEDSPKIVITPPVGPHVAGQVKDISIELKNVPDTSKWFVTASIEAPSSKDPDVYVRAVQKTFDPMVVSPFRTPAVASDTGLSIWQEEDGFTWHVRYAGTAEGVKVNDTTEADTTVLRRDAYVAIRFVNRDIDWSATVEADSTESLNFVVDSIRVTNDYVDVVVPAYNTTKMWKAGDDSVHLVFKTTAPFIVDASSIDGAKYKNTLSPVVYVHPESYKAHVAWDGLVNRTYSSGRLAKIKVIAYEKGNEKNIISQDQDWYLEYEKTGIEISSNNLERYYINFLGSNTEGTETIMGDYGFQFKLTGQSAKVTAEIIDSDNNIVHTLIKDSLVIATSANQWNTLHWNGMDEEGFVHPGLYNVHLIAKNDTETFIDTLYPFEISLGENIVKAEKDAEGRGADFKMLEASLDEDEKWRYVGKPDYILKTDVSATVLPEDRRTFNYEWDVYGTQHPLVYQKTRPSLGIQRHRDEFWATVVTLVIGETRDYNGRYKPGDARFWKWGETECNEVTENNEYRYRIQVERKQFKKGKIVDNIVVDLHPENSLHNDEHIYGYLLTLTSLIPLRVKPVKLHTLAAVKIYPASSFDVIVDHLTGTSVIGNAVQNAGGTHLDDLHWSDIYNKNIYIPGTRLYEWFTDFGGQALYYEAVNKELDVLANKEYLENISSKGTLDACEVDDILAQELADDDSKFVCGARQAKDEVNKDLVSQFNPHASMMKVTLTPVSGKDFVPVKNYDEEHCGYDNSPTDIRIRFNLEVNPDYWNPPADKWGTNNLANRYVRFDPVNKALYGSDGYAKVLADSGIWNFYNGSSWIADASFNNGPTVFEAMRLPIYNTEENPLLFNDELNAKKYVNDFVKYYPSEYSWRFYRGNGAITYRAVAKSLDGTTLATFQSDESNAKKGLDVPIEGLRQLPYDIYFDVAPVMTLDDAKNSSAIRTSQTAVNYPLGNGSCTVKESGYQFYGCDKWVSRVHWNVHDWNDSQWKDTFMLDGHFRNPLTDANVDSKALTSKATPTAVAGASGTPHYDIKPEDWNEIDSVWSFELKEPTSDVDEIMENISIGKYVLKNNNGNSSDWKITPSNASVYSISNRGIEQSSTIDFYRSRDTIFTSDKGLNNGQKKENIPLASIVAQSSDLADTILSSKWAQNHMVGYKGIFKRDKRDDSENPHPYLIAKYDSDGKKFVVTRNSQDIYVSREDEFVTLRGSVPYDISEWTISYVQNGVRLKIADGTKEPIEAIKNVNELQGNTSFFLTYKGTNDVVSYQQLDVHIGERVKAGEERFVYSMYGNVSIHFDEDAWTRDVDVTVRTMDPGECAECGLFRNMEPVGPVLEVLPSHKFPEGAEPTVTVDISMATLNSENVDYRNLKIYKVSAEKDSIIPLETQGGLELLDSSGDPCKTQELDPYSCAFVRIIAKTPTFSKFVILDSLKATDVEVVDTIPETVVAFSCPQMDNIWLDTLWMGTANGWLELPYLCSGKSNYLLQLSVAGKVSAEHRGASAESIVWPARNTDLYVLDSAYQSSIVFYGVDGNTEQKLGPVVRLDSVAPVIENVETTVSENEDGARVVHVEVEAEEAGSGIAQTTVELFLGGSLLQSQNVLGDVLPTFDFVLSKKDLYGCVGCQATIKVIAQDKGHNTDKVVKQTEKLYPYPSSLVLWYPFAEGTGKTGHEVMTKDNRNRMHMDLSAVSNPWNGRYGVSLLNIADSASSRYRLSALDSLRPFTFEFTFIANNIQRNDWSILSFVGNNEWTFGVGTYNRYFIKVGSEQFFFNTKRDANISTHLVVVVNGKKASLYKNGQYVETISLSNDLWYGGNGRLSIGARNGIRSALGSISNLRFYSSALSAEQIQGVFDGVVSEETVNFDAVRVVALTDRDGLTIDQSCSAPGWSYLRQKNADNSGVMTWHADVNADNYSLYILHRNYASEESKVEVSVNGTSVGTFKLTSTGYWKSEKVAGVNLNLPAGVNEISVRPLGNLGVVALALASTSANIDGNQISYNEPSWTNPDPKAKVLMKYESVDDKKWAQVRFDVSNITDQALENMRLRYYYKGEGESVNAVSFYPGSPMSVVNDAGSVFYAEFAFTEAVAAYGKAYFGQGPLIGLHRLTAPNNYFPYWDKTDDPSYLQGAETEYVDATGIALLDAEGNLLNEFSCYDEDGPIQKAKIKVRAMAKDNSYGSPSVSDIVAYVENIGNAPVDGFEMRYYFRDTAKTEMDIHWNAFATNSKVNAGGDLYYVSFMYDVILNSGDKSDYGNGVQFALHHPNRTNDFNAADDPSHHNLNNYEMVEADSIVVLDGRGNLLWGGVPQPKFGANYVTKEAYADLVHREGDVVYVVIEENGYYTLETVNAIGVPLKILYKGTWDAGEHSVTVDLNSLQPSSFIVLRKGAEILSWKLLN